MVILLSFFRRLARRTARSDGALVIALLALVLLIGTFSYAYLEGWGLLDALYATVITITTVGYGDLSPATPAGHLFAILFTLIAIGIGGYAISTVAANVIENRANTKAKKLRKRRMRRLDKLQDHYILCGANMIGIRIAEEFYLNDARFVIIDGNEDKLRHALLYTHPDYFRQKIQSIMDFSEADLSEFEDRSLAELGELLDTGYILDNQINDDALVQAGIGRAKGLIAAMEDDRDNLAIIVGAKALAKRFGNTQLNIMARVEKGTYMRKMYLAGADFVRIPAVASGLEMAAHMLHPEMGKWWYSVMGVHKKDAPRIEQKTAGTESGWVGKTVGQLHQLKDVVTLAVKRDDEFVSPPPADLMLAPDDILITLSHTDVST